MLLTQSNLIRGLSKRECLMLRMMCLFSNNLYNVTLYNIRQHYFAEKKYLRYEANYYVTKDNENYKLLQAGVSQQTMKVVDRAFQSFFALLSKARDGEYRFNQIRLPRYRRKGGLFNLIMQSNAIRINKEGWLNIPMSNAFKSIFYRERIKIRVPQRLLGHKMKEVRIIPICGGRKFKIQYVYEVEPEDLKLNQSNALSIDIGLENLATCISTVGTSFIMDGRRMKSINRLWNKRCADLQSRLPKGQHASKLLQLLTLKRNNRMNDKIKKTARYIINHCILCSRYGMKYLEQEESYTSKASFLDGDDIPIYDADNPHRYKFSGKRIKRGLYRTSDGTLVNADLNGAANILRKSMRNFDKEGLSRGLLASPLRIRLV